jgi:PPK2 family polyphosphate:nucleotide phosphotransferase
MKRYRVPSGSRVDLKDWDPNDRLAFDGSKKDAEPKLLELRDKLESLQELLYAEHKHRLLVVLQAMDAGGKDGTISHVFEGVNPQGVSVVSLKAPSSLERAHDYLWRIHQPVPGDGEMVIFNRSQYEDVLIVRVHAMVPADVWKRRYDQINAFEQMLSDEGTTILKFFLNISKDEQKKRLQDRLDDPRKRWKFNAADLAERRLWPDYMRAYEDVLSRTSTAWAPWYIVPANTNWYRNLVVASTIVNALEDLQMKYPEGPPGLDKIRID